MPGIHKSLWFLTEAMQQKVSTFQHQLDINNIPHVIMETLRDQDVQDAYYSQGRQPLEQVNALRATAQLPPITEKDNGNIITHAKVSNHSSGQAIDMPPSRASYPDDPWWNAPAEVWEKMAVLAESCGLVAGYHWKGFVDADHFEMPGLS